MKKREVIQIIKDHHYKEWYGQKITDENTRDRVLFGSVDEECTGVVTAIYASVDVIKEAVKRNANLIVAHEALFWNHGDHTDWLEDHESYQLKRKLLADHHITVWRDHDHIHAGLDFQNRRVDGIFYGLLATLGWENYLEGDIGYPLIVEIPRMKTRDLIAEIISKLELNGIKCLGDLDGESQRIYLPMHVMGDDNDKMTVVNQEHIDTVIAMECIDYTLGIYIRDAAMLGLNKRILAVGHFNLEEPGMKWFGEVYLPRILPDVPVSFVRAGDMYSFVLRR